MKHILLFFVSLIITNTYTIQFDQVVIWGHPLHSHTHSYIHAAFARTFHALGYKTLWLSDNDDGSDIDFTNSLFITEGQADDNIPLRDDCWYIIHNCNQKKYKNLLANNRCIILQVYTHDVPERKARKIEPCIYYDIPNKMIYMPWATDLLPEEIDLVKKTITLPKQPYASFIGTIYSGYFGNWPEIHKFKQACAENNIPFINRTKINIEETIHLTRDVAMAPAIQGYWQVEKGYIPCRIFKNISYGALGITNSKTVWELFDKKIIYNPDCYQLFYDAQKYLKKLTKKKLFKLMDIVKDKHTYVNRINHLLKFFEATQLQKKPFELSLKNDASLKKES